MLSGSFFLKYGFVVYLSITIQTNFGVCILQFIRDLILLNPENVKEGIAQCVEKMEKDRVTDRA